MMPVINFTQQSDSFRSKNTWAESSNIAGKKTTALLNHTTFPMKGLPITSIMMDMSNES